MDHSTKENTLRAIRNQKKQYIKTSTNWLEQLPSSLNLEELSKQYHNKHRDRWFNPSKTLHLFLQQIFNADKSCHQAVIQAMIHHCASSDSVATFSTNTAAYCKARQRLSTHLITHLSEELGKHVSSDSLEPWKWCNRSVKLVDATTLSMPDTSENQAAYPQIPGQKPGLGFPIIRLTAIICLASGAILNTATGHYQTSEHALFRSLISHLSEGDVLVGDRLYCSYFLIALLIQQGVDCVFRLHPMRKFYPRHGIWLGKDDHIVVWHKPARPQWLDPELYKQMPDRIRMREFKKGHLMIATTLHDKVLYPKNKIQELYYHRWQIELDFRAIKNVMQMDILRCKTPPMILKEIGVFVLGYNLLRYILVQSAQLFKKRPRQLSYKAGLQCMISYCSIIGLVTEHRRKKIHEKILLALSQHLVGNRPHRKEPRATKRRPKPNNYLMEPRRIAQQKLMDLAA